MDALSPLAGLGGVTAPGMPTMLPGGGQALQRCCGAAGVPPGAVDPSMGLQAQQMQILFQLLQMLVALMLGGQGQPGSAPGAGAGGIASPGGGAAPAGVGGAAAADAPAGGAGAGDGANARIGPGTKVLEIGDSHTVGVFGQELEKLLEGRGADVERHAAVGTSAGHWVNGGHGAKPLQDLIARSKPDVVIINLGANSRGGVGSDVKRLAQIAKNSGAQVIWVGPPRTRQDMANPAALQQFDAQMRAQLQGLGTYVSSAPYTSYDGPDGIHYNAGAARRWAQGVFGALG